MPQYFLQIFAVITIVVFLTGCSTLNRKNGGDQSHSIENSNTNTHGSNSDQEYRMDSGRDNNSSGTIGCTLGATYNVGFILPTTLLLIWGVEVPINLTSGLLGLSYQSTVSDKFQEKLAYRVKGSEPAKICCVLNKCRG